MNLLVNIFPVRSKLYLSIAKLQQYKKRYETTTYLISLQQYIIFILNHNIINEINIIHLKIQYKCNNET